MAKNPFLQFHEAKVHAVHNLEEIQIRLSRCVERGMLDPNAGYYNDLLVLIDEAKMSKEWAELQEVITRAKIFEVDVAAWLAGHGQTTISLPWPSPPPPI